MHRYSLSKYDSQNFYISLEVLSQVNKFSLRNKYRILLQYFALAPHTSAHYINVSRTVHQIKLLYRRAQKAVHVRLYVQYGL
jgi:hypothetical protein